MNSQNKPKLSAMMEAFLKMTPEQREYVYQMTRGKIPDVDIAYRAARNAELFQKSNHGAY